MLSEKTGREEDLEENLFYLKRFGDYLYYLKRLGQNLCYLK